jgi:hypothetical protein
MPTAAKKILLILLIPFLLAVGHDIYINYLSDDEKIREIKSLRIDPNKFMMSDTGWLWQEYSPSTMEMTRDMTEQDYWKNKIDPILQQPSIYLTILPFLGGVVGLILTFILGVWPFSRLRDQRKRDKAGYGIYKKARGRKITYGKK